MLKSDLLWGLTGLLNVWDMLPMGIHTIKICTITSSNEMEKLPFMYVFITNDALLGKPKLKYITMKS